MCFLKPSSGSRTSRSVSRAHSRFICSSFCRSESSLARLPFRPRGTGADRPAVATAGREVTLWSGAVARLRRFDYSSACHPWGHDQSASHQWGATHRPSSFRGGRETFQNVTNSGIWLKRFLKFFSVFLLITDRGILMSELKFPQTVNCVCCM